MLRRPKKRDYKQLQAAFQKSTGNILKASLDSCDEETRKTIGRRLYVNAVDTGSKSPCTAAFDVYTRKGILGLLGFRTYAGHFSFSAQEKEKVVRVTFSQPDGLYFPTTTNFFALDISASEFQKKGAVEGKLAAGIGNAIKGGKFEHKGVYSPLPF